RGGVRGCLARRPENREAPALRKKMQAVASKPTAAATAVRRSVRSRANTAASRAGPLGFGSPLSRAGASNTSKKRTAADSNARQKSNRDSHRVRGGDGMALGRAWGAGFSNGFHV